MVIVDTRSGPVQGAQAHGVRSWLGIPYAAPPVGDLRFRPPAPVEPWREPRPATAFGAAAPQLTAAQQRAMPQAPLASAMLELLYPGSGSPVGDVAVDEDCLVLNVWAPDAADGLPVMVWFHGGAFLHGAGSEPAFLGDRLAARHGVVVVTVNHRLGALGYLPVDEDGAGQAGMLDLVAALEWVRDNIAAFGGDPGNVTVFGQSGGGMKAATLMAMPAAAGLFHKAIVMSGPALRLPRMSDAAPLGAALFGALGLEPGDVAGLRRVPADAIVAAQFAAMAQVSVAPAGWGPVCDGRHILADPVSSVETAAPAVPLLTGSTSEEAGMFLAMDPAYPHLDDQALEARIRAEFADGADRVLDRYRTDFPDADARGILRRIVSDRDIRLSARRFAERKAAASTAPVYAYTFDYAAGVLDGLLGATHSGELAFVFDNADRIPLSGERPDRDALAAQMATAWTAFARTGDPSTPEVRWQPFTLEHPVSMVFDGATAHPEEDGDGARFALLATHPSRLFPRD